ncbi:MAG: SDR family oxidoreductase [Gammaproteobacteria bacterium]
MTQSTIDRRTFLGLGAAGGALLVSGCGEDEPPARPAGVPVSPFGAKSTAEEVTAGLDLTGRTALVTGCNSGLGYETMRVLAQRGAHVIGTGRTLEKARDACASVQGRTTPVALELAQFETVVACADTVRQLETPIDMLICNAGIMALPELRQDYGLERHFVVNHLGHFILVNHLLDLVKAAPQGRVVTVASAGHQWAPEVGIEFDNLSGERGYEPNRAYGHSKLANGLFTLELARRLDGTTTTANTVHPGVILTNLGRHFEQWKLVAARLIGWAFMKSVEAGAATTCFVATHPSLSETSGYYFADCNPELPGQHMQDREMAAELWDVSLQLTAEYLG